MAQQKTILKQVEGFLSGLPLEERLKNPLYLNILCAKMNAKMNIITKHLPQHHNLTSNTGHFGVRSKYEEGNHAS